MKDEDLNTHMKYYIQFTNWFNSFSSYQRFLIGLTVGAIILILFA